MCETWTGDVATRGAIRNDIFRSCCRMAKEHRVIAKGYPSRYRARQAFWRGVKAARTGRGMNPYKHPVLKELFERGRITTPTIPPPPGVYPASPKRRAPMLNRGARASDS